MPKHMPYKRADRVGEEIRKTIAQLLIEGHLRDPRLSLCSITRVKLADDLRDGRVFFSLLGDTSASAEIEHVLNRAAGYIKAEIGHRLQLRFTPNLRFAYDVTLEQAARINELLKEIQPGETAAGEPSATDDDEES